MFLRTLPFAPGSFAPYVSDTFQATPKLTLYGGLGWDYLPVPHRENRGIEYYDTASNVYDLCGEGSVPQTAAFSFKSAFRSASRFRL